MNIKSKTGTKNVATKNATQHKNVATKKVVEMIQEDSELTEKQKLFCLYFSQFNNATKAYRKAYECEYSTAMVEGSKSLRNPKIRTEIKRIKAARSNDWLMDDKDIINEWMKMAFSDITDYVEFGVEEVDKTSWYNPNSFTCDNACLLPRVSVEMTSFSSASNLDKASLM